jgi:hypothetical protein
MKIAYFDCFSGIAGDMILGALLDVGVNKNFLIKQLKKLPLKNYTFEVTRVERNHIAATDVLITPTKEEQIRSLSDIIGLIKKSSLAPQIKHMSTQIFQRLGSAEAKIHEIEIEQVHFHEVGAVDSILDIVGSVIGITSLEVDKIFCSPLPIGHGFVHCAHGLLPLPAPATVELLKGIPVYAVDRDHELVTPTGAAVITTIASHFGEMPPMRIERIGYGSGKIQSTYPNILRLYIGEIITEKGKKSK